MKNKVLVIGIIAVVIVFILSCAFLTATAMLSDNDDDVSRSVDSTLAAMATDIPEATNTATLVPTKEATATVAPTRTATATRIPSLTPVVHNKSVEEQLVEIIEVIEKVGPILDGDMGNLRFASAKEDLLPIFAELLEIEVDEELGVFHIYAMMYVSELIESCNDGLLEDLEAAIAHLETANEVLDLMLEIAESYL